ncbi:CHAT domain-containing protein [Streptomyces sp. NPDC059378]|uniref:CHAT domain-containing protein n=1 Tax=Streptomyces sp. NPDC059378 TaxID=3346815 RepID=UPI0036C40D4F
MPENDGPAARTHDLAARIRRAADDPAALRSDEALADVETLVATVDRAAAPVTALGDAARLCARRTVLDEPAGSSDPLLTVALATVLAAADPAAVPAGVDKLLRGLTERHPGQMEVLRQPRVWVWKAQGLPLTDPAALTLLRLARLALPVTDPTAHDVVTVLAGRLLRLHRYEGGGTGRPAEAALRCRTAVAAGGAEHGGLLTNFALVLLERFWDEEDPELLDEALATARQALAVAAAPDRPSALTHLITVLGARAEHLRRRPDAEEGVTLARRLLADGTPDASALALRRCTLSEALQQLYGLTGEPAVLDEAVALARAAADVCPADSPGLFTVRNALGAVLHEHQERTGSLAALRETVTAFRSALELLGDDRPERAWAMSNLGFALYGLGSRTADAALLAEAVDLCRRAAGATPAGRPKEAGHLINLSTACLGLAERTGDDGAFTDAVRYARGAVAAAPPDRPGRAAALTALGTALETCARMAGFAVDLAEAVEAHRTALGATPDRDPARATRLSQLGVALLAHAERTGVVEELTEALAAVEEAVALTPAGHAALGARLTNRSLAEQAWYDRTGDTASLRRAVRTAREVVALDTEDAGQRAGRLSNLGLILHAGLRHGYRPGAAEELREAVAVSRQAAEGVPAGHPDRPGFLSNLSLVLVAGYEHTGGAPLLDEALRMSEEAVVTAPEGHPARPRFLSQLGIVLQVRNGLSRRRDELDRAVELTRRAVEATPPGHYDLGHHLADLVDVLLARYDLTGALDSLEEAAGAADAALSAMAADDPWRPTVLQKLALVRKFHHERTQSRTSLRKAVEAAEEAVSGTPGGHPARPGRLSTLAEVLLAAFFGLGEDDCLRQALTVAQEAVDTTPDGHPALAARLTRLSLVLRCRHERFHDPAALAQAVTAARRAVDLTGSGSPDHAAMHYQLGEALETLHTDMSAPGALAETVDAFRTAARSVNASPVLRVLAAAAGGRVAASWQDLEPALGLLADAITLLGSVAPPDLSRPDQEHRLTRFPGIASDAAACAVRLGDPERAAALLEQGRGILLAQSLDARTDISDLARRHPERAARLTALMTERSAEPSGLPTETRPSRVPALGTGRAAERRQAATLELDRLLDEIRRDPQDAGFLRPPEPAELRAAAQDGPVVLVNVSQYGSHALLVRPAAVEAVPLPGLDAFRSEQRVRAFYSALETVRSRAPAERRREAESAITEVLGWLWDTVAHPVLRALGLDRPPTPGTPPPRLWWSATGPLGMLPLHAATRPAPGPRLAVLDLVTSSYTPTLRALAHARRRAAGTASGPALAVCMARTPGHRDLPGSADELRLLGEVFKDALTALSGADARRTDILSELPGHAFAHFACHAVADPAAPSAGRLLVHDHRHRPLTVTDVIALDLPRAELAFLSACETARTGPALVDESIHLGSAFQIAGFRQVVATLWPVSDRRAVHLARTVYEAVARAGTTAVVPTALHETVRRWRDTWPDNPSVWAVHVHSGA